VFEQFTSQYELGAENQALIWNDSILMDISGYPLIAPKVAGQVLGDGLLYFFSKDDGPKAQQYVGDAFPEFDCTPFARDWLGRVFAVNRKGNSGTSAGLLLLEPGSGEAYEIDESFKDFLDVALVNDPDTYLESELWDSWRSSGGEVPGVGQCIGFKVPLFLGGTGTLDNLELSDLQVYWDLCGQMRIATRDMPPGTQIGGVNLS
jgi:hypothetical protein